MMPSLRFGVDAAIALNYHARFIAVKVDNIFANLMLSSKLESEQLTVAQSIPEK